MVGVRVARQGVPYGTGGNVVDPTNSAFLKLLMQGGLLLHVLHIVRRGGTYGFGGSLLEGLYVSIYT